MERTHTSIANEFFFPTWRTWLCNGFNFHSEMKQVSGKIINSLQHTLFAIVPTANCQLWILIIQNKLSKMIKSMIPKQKETEIFSFVVFNRKKNENNLRVLVFQLYRIPVFRISPIRVVHNPRFLANPLVFCPVSIWRVWLLFAQPFSMLPFAVRSTMCLQQNKKNNNVLLKVLNQVDGSPKRQ